MMIRKANKDDIHSIFDLSNNKIVRKNSFNQKRIKFSDHEEWFNDKIDNPNYIFLIIEESKEFAGQIRFDVKNDEAVVSISVTDDFRMKGLGRKALIDAINLLKLEYPTIKIITAYVKESNTGSGIFFSKCNFIFSGKTCIGNDSSLVYKYQL